MKTLFSAALAAAGICAGAVAGAAAAPVSDAVTRASAHLSPVQSVRLDRRQAVPHHRRHATIAMQAAAPARRDVGTIYQDGAYTYRIGPDGRRWYEPTICNCGPQ